MSLLRLFIVIVISRPTCGNRIFRTRNALVRDRSRSRRRPSPVPGITFNLFAAFLRAPRPPALGRRTLPTGGRATGETLKTFLSSKDKGTRRRSVRRYNNIILGGGRDGGVYLWPCKSCTYYTRVYDYRYALEEIMRAPRTKVKKGSRRRVGAGGGRAVLAFPPCFCYLITYASRDPPPRAPVTAGRPLRRRLPANTQTRTL